jgi:hypothetical protein
MDRGSGRPCEDEQAHCNDGTGYHTGPKMVLEFSERPIHKAWENAVLEV